MVDRDEEVAGHRARERDRTRRGRQDRPSEDRRGDPPYRLGTRATADEQHPLRVEPERVERVGEPAQHALDRRPRDVSGRRVAQPQAAARTLKVVPEGGSA